MKLFGKYTFLFVLVFGLNQAIAMDQVDPIKVTVDGYSNKGDQIDPQNKSSMENSSLLSEEDKKKPKSQSKNGQANEEYIKSFSSIILNSLHQEFVNSKRESFFILPFSLNL